MLKTFRRRYDVRGVRRSAYRARLKKYATLTGHSDRYYLLQASSVIEAASRDGRTVRGAV